MALNGCMPLFKKAQYSEFSFRVMVFNINPKSNQPLTLNSGCSKYWVFWVMDNFCTSRPSEWQFSESSAFWEKFWLTPCRTTHITVIIRLNMYLGFIFTAGIKYLLWVISLNTRRPPPPELCLARHCHRLVVPVGMITVTTTWVALNYFKWGVNPNLYRVLLLSNYYSNVYKVIHLLE